MQVSSGHESAHQCTPKLQEDQQRHAECNQLKGQIVSMNTHAYHSAVGAV